MASPTPNPNAPPPSYPGHPLFDFLESMGGGNFNAGAGVDHRPAQGPQFGGFPFAAFLNQSGEFSPFGGEGLRRGGPRCGRRGRGGARMSSQQATASAGAGAGASEGGSSEEEKNAMSSEKNGDREKDDSPETLVDAEDPPEEFPQEAHHHHGSEQHHGPGRCRRGPGSRRGHHHGPHPFWGSGPFGPGPHHHHHGFGGPRGGPGPHQHPHPHPPPPPHHPREFNFAFDGQNLRHMIGPYADLFRTWVTNMRDAAASAAVPNPNHDNADDNDSDTFQPPIDIFNTENAYILHVALPGAKKEDIGVSWDADKAELTVAGVVHRPGDEDFLKTLVSGERKAGMFERVVKLPPVGGEAEEVDDLAISAKMEDGILVITVPKLEKEWTEVRKVDIE